MNEIAGRLIHHITLEEKPKPVKKLTAKEILIDWLSKRVGQTIAYFDLEKSIVEYGRRIHGVTHEIIFYERQFRLLKKEPQIQLNNNGLSLEEVTGGKYMRWEIKTYKKED